ncbi:hypothetical protein NRB_25770 [Novosphingobium sp. 11B]
MGLEWTEGECLSENIIRHPREGGDPSDAGATGTVRKEMGSRLLGNDNDTGDGDHAVESRTRKKDAAFTAPLPSANQNLIETPAVARSVW